jgi:hypothetical protein
MGVHSKTHEINSGPSLGKVGLLTTELLICFSDIEIQLWG